MQLIHGDCLELMKEIPDKSIDLIVTDPPYLINYKTNRRKDKTHKFCTEINGDNDEELIRNYMAECFRILKDNSAMYCFCSAKTLNTFTSISKSSGFKLKNTIIWVKNSWTAGDLKAQFGQQYEPLLLLNKGRKEFTGKRLTDVWMFNRVSGKSLVHQNQKPVGLIEQCILKHSNEGDVVFDGFLGSGTTGVACINTKRNFIGIEKDDKYFEIAKKRIEEHLTTAST
jgi:site-specific DNA-methyltransferase (adenine-specific)